VFLFGNDLAALADVFSAYAMSKYFPGSVVLKQDSIGHCFASSPSKCTAKYIQGYLVGRMPPAGTVCKPDQLPFEEKEAVPDHRITFL
jgi:hypothetical protein